MSGNIVFKKGNSVIFSNEPGSEINLSSSYMKKKITPAKVSKRKIIEIFDKIAENESDSEWKQRFENMKISKFPGKISWVNGNEDSDIAGILVYKFRNIYHEQEILKTYSPLANAVIIKDFIKRYTNVGINTKDHDFLNISKDKIEVVSWNKLPYKDQTKKISKYVESYALRKSLDSDQKNQLLNTLILKSCLGTLFPALEFDKDGDILNIKGIVYDKNNDYFDLSY